jgi:hypothetical protein
MKLTNLLPLLASLSTVVSAARATQPQPSARSYQSQSIRNNGSGRSIELYFRDMVPELLQTTKPSSEEIVQGSPIKRFDVAVPLFAMQTQTS